MIWSPPAPPAPPTAAETAVWVTDAIEDKLVAQNAADRYAIGEVHCMDEPAPGEFVCASPWIHHGLTQYLTGRFTWTGDGYECDGWTVTDDPPPWYEAAAPAEQGTHPAATA